MPVNLGALGATSGPVDIEWACDDALLYALSVGAGHKDPTQELQFTTETRGPLVQQALPTFAAALSFRAMRRPDIGAIDATRGLHLEYSLRLHRQVPIQGSARAVTAVDGLFDVGTGAVVDYLTTMTLGPMHDPLLTARSSEFIRGEGNFGGHAPPPPHWPAPCGTPHVSVVFTTQPEQALLYRLTGDRNPLHSNPEFAASCGFPKPILQGLCVFGMAGRALLHETCESDPARVLAMSARFTAPVFPGDTLQVLAWRHGEEYSFRAINQSGVTVLNRGTLRVAHRLSS